MNFKEIETKYNAESISYDTFAKFCLEREPEKFILASGYDHFFSNPKELESFFRHRVGSDISQLTFKRKTIERNNFVRHEYNLDTTMSEDEVKAYVGAFGYEYNTSIFKTCFVYKYSYFILSYYICYDIHMKELGRFVEIEMREDFDFGSEDKAWSALLVLEKLCKDIGINPKARIKRSLYEMYRKET